MDIPSISCLLDEAKTGDKSNRDQLFSAIYEQLHFVAKKLMLDEKHGHTLQPTALINEVYIKYCRSGEIKSENKAQLLAFLIKAMKNVLISHARKKNADKRFGGLEKLQFRTDDFYINEHKVVDFVVLEEAMASLKDLSKRQAQVFELRFYCGFNTDEIAGFLEVSPATVRADFAMARGWLRKRLI